MLGAAGGWSTVGLPPSWLCLSSVPRVLSFKKEYGRLFEPSGRYKYPVDDREKEHLKLTHEATTSVPGGRLSAALIKLNSRGSFLVLDIGTSTRI